MVLAAGERLWVKSLEVHIVHTTRALGMSFDAMDVVRAVHEDFNTGKIEHTLNKQEKRSFAKQETMPTDACQFYYQCPSCNVLLRPNPGDCCVFCSFRNAAAQ
jgi:hypothetical protein